MEHEADVTVGGEGPQQPGPPAFGAWERTVQWRRGRQERDPYGNVSQRTDVGLCTQPILQFASIICSGSAVEGAEHGCGCRAEGYVSAYLNRMSFL